MCIVVCMITKTRDREKDGEKRKLYEKLKSSNYSAESFYEFWSYYRHNILTYKYEINT